jgi:Domain of unknown function (DUF4265)
LTAAGLVKITFPLELGAWHGFATERMWAQKVSDNRYRLRNSPYFARGVSFEDVVFAELDPQEELIFTGVSLRSGHSTYRIVLKFELDSLQFREHWAPLEKDGCTFEGAREKLLAVDVPPRADIYGVYALLQRGENAGAWEFEEGHCGHPLHGKG